MAVVHQYYSPIEPQAQNTSLQLFAAEATQDDNSLIALSPRIMQQLDVCPGYFMLVQGRNKKDTILVVVTDNSISDDHARINQCVRSNLRVILGDGITVQHFRGMEDAKRVAILPLADSISDFKGSLFDTFLQPYFRGARKPVRQGDYFTCRGDGREVQFRVKHVDPPECAIVRDDTIIYCQGDYLVREQEEDDRVWLDDVGGYKQELARIRELIEMCINQSAAFKAKHIKPPRGILISGPSGCGKSLILRALCNDMGDDFGLFVFVPAMARIKTLSVAEAMEALKVAFTSVENNLPALLIIDELDGLAKPEAGGEGVNRTLISQLVSYMDSLDPLTRVVFVAATNRVDDLDRTLRSYGRFDQHIRLDTPTSDERFQILQQLTRNLQLDSDVNLKSIASLTEGYLGSDLASLCSKAIMQQMREGNRSNMVEGSKSSLVNMKHLHCGLAEMKGYSRQEASGTETTVEKEFVGKSSGQSDLPSPNPVTRDESPQNKDMPSAKPREKKGVKAWAKKLLLPNRSVPKQGQSGSTTTSTKPQPLLATELPTRSMKVKQSAIAQLDTVETRTTDTPPAQSMQDIQPATVQPGIFQVKTTDTGAANTPPKEANSTPQQLSSRTVAEQIKLLGLNLPSSDPTLQQYHTFQWPSASGQANMVKAFAEQNDGTHPYVKKNSTGTIEHEYDLAAYVKLLQRDRSPFRLTSDGRRFDTIRYLVFAGNRGINEDRAGFVRICGDNADFMKLVLDMSLLESDRKKEQVLAWMLVYAIRYNKPVAAELVWKRGLDKHVRSAETAPQSVYDPFHHLGEEMENSRKGDAQHKTVARKLAEMGAYDAIAEMMRRSSADQKAAASSKPSAAAVKSKVNSRPIATDQDETTTKFEVLRWD